MPPDLKVVAPPPSVSRENARFAGRWIGKWEEQLDHVLVVELVVQNEQAAEVVAVYSWGGARRGLAGLVACPGPYRERELAPRADARPGDGRLHHAARRHPGGRILAR
jgi:hypothetical protein